MGYVYMYMLPTTRLGVLGRTWRGRPSWLLLHSEVKVKLVPGAAGVVVEWSSTRRDVGADFEVSVWALRAAGAATTLTANG